MSKKRKHKIKLEIGNFYRVLDERRDLKGRFSLFEIELKDGVDVSYPDIKKPEGHRCIKMMIVQQ